MKKKILVVDDGPDIREILRLYLENAGYEVYQAENGKVALDIIGENKIDLMVLDIMMPVMDGYELMKELGEERSFPVIFLSAKDQVSDKILGLNLGGDDYIAKPFDPGELIARVMAVLRRSQDKPEKQRIKIGNIEWNQESRMVYKDGHVLSLRAKEYQLLTLFMSRPGKVFTKEEIYEFLWEEPYFHDDNTIMVHISNLREKIEDHAKKPEKILTIRGLGYMMKGD